MDYKAEDVISFCRGKGRTEIHSHYREEFDRARKNGHRVRIFLTESEQILHLSQPVLQLADQVILLKTARTDFVKNRFF